MRAFGERLKGFEPSTFCVASSSSDSAHVLNFPANRPLLPPERVSQMSGFYREITGVSGLKPDWR